MLFSVALILMILAVASTSDDVSDPTILPETPAAPGHRSFQRQRSPTTGSRFERETSFAWSSERSVDLNDVGGSTMMRRRSAKTTTEPPAKEKQAESE